VNIRQWFCKHDWKKHSEAVLPSAFEQTMRTGEFRLNPQSIQTKLDGWLFKKKVVIIMICKKCNKLQIYTEENP
jgi:hypothetical protein